MPGPFALSDPKKVERVFKGAGFDGVQLKTTTLNIEYESAEQFTDLLVDVVAPIRRLVTTQPAAEQARLLRLIQESTAPFTKDDGRVVLPCQVHLVWGAK